MSETDDAETITPPSGALAITPAARRDLRARAHHLHAVVSIGHQGLTPQVLHEIDVALVAHGLVKVRVFGDDRDAREALLARIAGELACAPVQHLGKLLVLWRPQPEANATAKKSGAAKKSGVAKNSGAARRTAAAKGGAKAGSGKGAKKTTGKTGATSSRKTRAAAVDDSERRRPTKVPRRARGQPLPAMDEPERLPRSPKAPRSTPSSSKAPRGKGRSAIPDPTHRPGPGQATRMSPTVAPRVAGHGRAGGSVGVPKARNPRRRRTG